MTPSSSSCHSWLRCSTVWRTSRLRLPSWSQVSSNWRAGRGRRERRWTKLWMRWEKRWGVWSETSPCWNTAWTRGRERRWWNVVRWRQRHQVHPPQQKHREHKVQREIDEGDDGDEGSTYVSRNYNVMPMSFPYVSRNTIQFNADVNVKKCVASFVPSFHHDVVWDPVSPLHLIFSTHPKRGWEVVFIIFNARGSQRETKNKK